MGRQGQGGRRWLAGLAVGALAAGWAGYAVGAAVEPAAGSPAAPVGIRAAGLPHLLSAPAPARHLWPRAAWVAVPVASVWNTPALARPIDGPVLTARPQIDQWLSALTFDERLDLDNRLATQALLGDPLVVLGEAGGWAHVLVDDQRGSVYPAGIAGWLPAAQVTLRRPPVARATVTVAVPRVVAGGLGLSYGTRLPVVGSRPGGVVLAAPGGPVTLPAADVRRAPLPADGASVVQEAERFIGLPYLWAGTSGFGFDCSGLTYMIYRQVGITLPRDAADQAGVGTPVSPDGLRPGDLVFYRFGGSIDHVGIYAGGGRMIDSPQTGGAVEVVPMWGTPLAAHFAGARRYLP